MERSAKAVLLMNRDSALPCPFCGADGVSDAFSVPYKTPEYFVRCQSCGTIGPVAGDERAAIARWNFRHEHR